MLTRHTVQSFDVYLDELADKMGSDYFPLSVKINRFIGFTLDFLRKTTLYIEGTQEISEDIQPLFVRKQSSLTKILPSLYVAKVPNDLFRLSSIMPYYYNASLDSKDTDLEKDNPGNPEMIFISNIFDNINYKTNVKKISIIKDGQQQSFNRDPFNNATPEYPNVTRLKEGYRIDFGSKPDLDYNKVIMTYIKNPIFGRESVLTDRLVDLPDILVERIIAKTADSLRFTTGDKDASSNFQFNQTFGNKKSN